MQKLDFTTKPSHSQLCELTRFYRRCAMRGGIGFRAIYTGLRHFVNFALSQIYPSPFTCRKSLLYALFTILSLFARIAVVSSTFTRFDNFSDLIRLEQAKNRGSASTQVWLPTQQTVEHAVCKRRYAQMANAAPPRRINSYLAGGAAFAHDWTSVVTGGGVTL